MSMATEWREFADYFSASKVVIPGKKVSRFVEDGCHRWLKEEHEQRREVALHQFLGERGRLNQVQQFVRVDSQKRTFVTADAGRDLWDWLWICAKAENADEPPVLVSREDGISAPGHQSVRRHILNWDDTVLRFAAGALEVLDQVHALGIVHFDLHLANWCLPAINPSTIDSEAASRQHRLRLGLLVDQPHLIDFSESLWEDRLPLGCVPRHVRALLDSSSWDLVKSRHRLSNQFRYVAERVREEARADRQFNGASREDQWRLLIDRNWCDQHGLKSVIRALLSDHLDWREDLYQLGFLLSQLMGEVAEGSRLVQDMRLAWRGSPQGGAGVRTLARLPSLASLPPREEHLRLHLIKVVDTLKSYADDPAVPHPAERPHRRLAREIRETLTAEGFNPHALIEFAFEFVAPHKADSGRAAPPPSSLPFVPEMVRIPIGTYRIGPPLRVRAITSTRALEVARDPVTVEQFHVFALTQPAWQTRWRFDKSRVKHPMTNVTREDAQAYARWLTRETAAAGCLNPYRLLTSDEWEVCCRAGTLLDYGIGPAGASDVDRRTAVYSWSARNRALHHWHPRANLVEAVDVHSAHNATNAFGLRGMHGNVWEIVLGDGERTVELRGGSFTSSPEELVAHHRRKVPPEFFADNTGFRICRLLESDPRS